MAISVSRLRPPLLPVYRTCIWKVIDGVQIASDIYLPESSCGSEHPILLFVHGGGWISSNKTDYSRPLFHEFLALGFVVVSIDYRLLPETPLQGQLEDIRDIETWLKQNLSAELSETSFRIATNNIIVAGGSAGAHLALLTPKLWSTPPTAILSLYGPTNLHSVPHLHRGRLPHYIVPPCTSEVLAAATDYAKPPTDTGCPIMSQAFATPRSQVALEMFRKGLVSEFLLKGLTRIEDGRLEMPTKGCVCTEEVDEISPLHLSQRIAYPPTYQIIGTEDDIFAIDHVTSFYDSLTSQGIPCEQILVPGAGHAFDIYEKIGDEVHTKLLKPAVEWVAKFVISGEAIASQVEAERVSGDQSAPLKYLPEGKFLKCCC